MRTTQSGFREVAARYPDIPPLIILKLDIQRRGAVLTPPALQKLRDVPAWMKCTMFYREGKPAVSHSVLLLRDGSSITAFSPARAPEGPYIIDAVDGRYQLLDGEDPVDEVEFCHTPAYCGKFTGRGTPLEHLIASRKQTLDICSFRHCMFRDTGDMCRFCSFFLDPETGRENLPESGRISDPEEIAEAVREAAREPGCVSEIALTGGSDPSGSTLYENEFLRNFKILQAVGKVLGPGRFPSHLLGSAYSRTQLQRLRAETGVNNFCADLEVWDAELFARLCPGKAKWPGRDGWLRTLLDAVDIFGKGNVCSIIVAGVETATGRFRSEDEALESTLGGAEYLAKNGVAMLMRVWTPRAGTTLFTAQPASLDYLVRLARGIHLIKRSYGLQSVDHDYRHCGNHADTDLDRAKTGPKSFAQLNAAARSDPVTLPDAVNALALAPGTTCDLQTADCDGKQSTSAMPFWRFLGGGLFALAESSCDSQTQRNLTFALWAQAPVWLTLRNGKSCRIRARVRKCVLTGPLYREFCLRAHDSRSPSAGVESVWQLWVENVEEAEISAAHREKHARR